MERFAKRSHVNIDSSVADMHSAWPDAFEDFVPRENLSWRAHQKLQEPQV
jgi:hypothetical protein